VSPNQASGVINKPTAYAQYVDLSVAQKLTAAPTGGTGAAMPDRVIRALIQPEGGDMRWCDDGTVPTAAIGMILKDGIVLEYEGNLETFQFIRTVAGVKLNVLYYKY